MSWGLRLGCAWDGGLGGGKVVIWPESLAFVSPENLGRKPVRFAQDEGGIAAESSAGGHGPGRGFLLASELDIPEKQSHYKCPNTNVCSRPVK